METERTVLSVSFCLMLALMLLVLPLRWIVAAVAAAGFHELCHICAIYLCGGKIGKFRLYGSGAKLALPEMSRGREALCALAGPIGGLSLLLFSRWMPRLAICALLQSLYNLLPIYPLDGGRTLQCLLSMVLSPPKSARACQIVSSVIRSLVCVAGLYGCFWLKLGPFPLVLAVLLLIRTK